MIPDAASIAGGQYGVCWGLFCRATVLYPPPDVTARVRCSSEFPHRGIAWASGLTAVEREALKAKEAA